MKKIFYINCLLFSVLIFAETTVELDQGIDFYTKVNPKNVVHRIQLCEYENFVPVKIVELMREIGDIKVVSEKGKSRYYTSPIASEELAEKLLSKYILYGFDQAKHVVEYKKEFYTINKFNYMAAE